MSLFDVPDIRTTREDDTAIVKKSKSTKSTTSKKSVGGGLLDTIERIRQVVEQNLGQYKDESIIINDKDVLHNYLDACIDNHIIAIDTETTGLNPLVDIIAGICIYTPNQKTAYIPINHVSYITGEKSANQLDAEVIIKEFDRMFDYKPDIDMFNATFDIRVLRHFGLSRAYCTWDSSIASRILNENETDKNLKDLHNKYCLDGKGDAFRFDDLFHKVKFTQIPYNVGYLYAAHDPLITYELSEYQRKHLRLDSEREDIRNMAWVFHNIEMPIVKVVCDMEDTGVEFDFNKNAEFKVKYHKLLDEREKAFIDVYTEDYSAEIMRYKIKNPDIFDEPINIKSSKQLSALLYDVIGLEGPVDKKTKQPTRSTKEDVLNELYQKTQNRVVKAIQDYREFSTIVSTFIDKLPECVHTDGRIHCKFNQYGADTGRFSSSEPNLQNIPSHNKEIRQMFKATDGYVLMSSDYSQQEPKCLAALCKQQGDPQMYNTFMQGKDLYAEIASKAFNRKYEDCLEFYLDENGKKTDKTNKEGKKYRTMSKGILLGVLYGRGEASIAEQLNCTEKEAKDIKESVFKGFPAIKQFEQTSLEMAKEVGYVTTVCGRKRRLPDLQLDAYEFVWKDGNCPYDDPLDFTMTDTLPVPIEQQQLYMNKLMNTKWYKEKQNIVMKADKEGIKVIDNGKKIADATRQCVNSRIQGSAADLTKLAMIKLDQNEELKELGFRMLIPVHDEIIVECPECNAKECAELLAKTMSDAAEEILEMPIRCDVEVTKVWYGEPINGKEKKVGESNTAREFENELSESNA